MFMNDLAYVGVNQSKLSAYADDTQIVHADQDPVKVQETINSDLANVDKWYAENGMKRNYTKYQAIVMEKCVIKPEFSCENTVIKNSDVLELLGVTVDEKLKFGMHVKKVCRKVSQQVAFLKRMSNMLPFETRLSIYTSFIVPHFNYCCESWHFCNISHQPIYCVHHYIISAGQIIIFDK
jgi:hypothetical protein